MNPPLQQTVFVSRILHSHWTQEEELKHSVIDPYEDCLGIMKVSHKRGGSDIVHSEVVTLVHRTLPQRNIRNELETTLSGGLIF